MDSEKLMSTALLLLILESDCSGRHAALSTNEDVDIF